MKNISFIITLFFIVSLSSLEKISAQPYTIKRLGMEDGLSSNYTQKIIQDQKGYIWVATSSGLNRFDGQKFILYGQDNHKTEQNWINSLLADPTNDNVWVGTDQGLFYFDYPTGSMMPHATPLSHLDKKHHGADRCYRLRYMDYPSYCRSYTLVCTRHHLLYPTDGTGIKRPFPDSCR